MSKDFVLPNGHRQRSSTGTSRKRDRFKAKALQLQRDWKGIASPEGEGPWFSEEDLEQVPDFDATDSPTKQRMPGGWSNFAASPTRRTTGKETDPGRRFDRSPYLQRTPFHELHSLHKTGTHAAIYRIDYRHSDASRCSVLCFRGTTKLRQWVLNLSTLPVRWPSDGEGAKPYVHQGFLILFEKSLAAPRTLVARTAAPIVHHRPQPRRRPRADDATRLADPPQALYTFGSPRVGNPAFVDRAVGFPHYRVAHHHDIVTLLPHAVETLLAVRLPPPRRTGSPARRRNRLAAGEAAHLPAQDLHLSHAPGVLRRSHPDRLRERVDQVFAVMTSALRRIKSSTSPGFGQR